MGKLSDQTEKTSLGQTDFIYLVQSPYGSGDDRKATIANLGNAVGRFQDRGDVSAYDWLTASFTKDDAWHDLDCSSIVPDGAKVISFIVYAQTTAVPKLFKMRKKGKTGTVVIDFQMWTQVVAGAIALTARVPCSTDRIVQYFANAATWTVLSLVISGWEF
jgi:hypothetical protein